MIAFTTETGSRIKCSSGDYCKGFIRPRVNPSGKLQASCVSCGRVVLVRLPHLSSNVIDKPPLPARPHGIPSCQPPHGRGLPAVE